MKEKMSRPTQEVYRQLALEITRGETAADGLLRFRVKGDSMAPLLQSGDSVLVAAVSPESIENGDLILFRRADEVVTHRVVAQSGAGWITKGDNRRQLDPAMSPQEILGRVVTIERGSEKMDLQKGRWRTTKRVMGIIGFLEGSLWRAGTAVKVRLGGRHAGQVWGWVGRLVAGLFVLLKRLIALVAGWSHRREFISKE